jgi:hypothetical protein
MKNRKAWGLVGVLLLVLVTGSGVLVAWRRPYWVARHRGEKAVLRRARLWGAPLGEAHLYQADLSATGLQNATLINADLHHACLTRANLCGADLLGANLQDTLLGGAVYDRHTRWPKGFDPAQYGAILVK